MKSDLVDKSVNRFNRMTDEDIISQVSLAFEKGTDVWFDLILSGILSDDIPIYITNREHYGFFSTHSLPTSQSDSIIL